MNIHRHNVDAYSPPPDVAPAPKSSNYNSEVTKKSTTISKFYRQADCAYIFLHPFIRLPLKVGRKIKADLQTVSSHACCI